MLNRFAKMVVARLARAFAAAFLFAARVGKTALYERRISAGLLQFRQNIYNPFSKQPNRLGGTIAWAS